MSLTDPVPASRAFACPRCATQVEEAWYGPCTTCRQDLRSTVRGEAHELATDDYVPKMNVTPNAVATKD